MGLTKKDLAELKILFDEFVEKSATQIQKNNKRSFQSKSGLDQVVIKGYISQFSQIENELIERGYLSEQYQWLKNKTTLCEFLVIIMHFQYVRVGKFITEIKIRRFFEARYGKEVNSLSEMFKPTKRPNFERARISFHFIYPPEKGN